MNWKTRFLRPVLKSLVHTAIAFLALMLFGAAWSAILQWRFFGLSMYIFTMIFGVQTGVIFIGSTLYALVTGRLPLMWAAVGVLVLVVLDLSFGLFHMYREPDTLWAFSALLIFPVFSLVFLFVPDIEKKIGNSSAKCRATGS